MSLKKYYYNKNIECCFTCMYIDEYAFNVSCGGNTPAGYDGMAACCIFDKAQEENPDNRDFISPRWKACKKYKRCTERQANYQDIFDDETHTIINNPNDISKIK